METATMTKVCEIGGEYGPRDAGIRVDGSCDVGEYSQLPDTLRPRNVKLENDGFREWWMHVDGEPITLTHDGVGWRVTGPEWAEGHVYRLADARQPRGAFVDRLPKDRPGFVELDRGTVYELRMAVLPHRGKTIELHAVGVNPSAS